MVMLIVEVVVLDIWTRVESVMNHPLIQTAFKEKRENVEPIVVIIMIKVG